MPKYLYPYRFETAQTALTEALHSLRVLSGDEIAPSSWGCDDWRGVAGIAVANLRLLADQIDAARKGNSEPFSSFPSPSDCACPLERAHTGE